MFPLASTSSDKWRRLQSNYMVDFNIVAFDTRILFACVILRLLFLNQSAH